MTCQECERQLGMGEDAAGHLAQCEECRRLAADLRLNAQALRNMRSRPTLHWTLAAAALVMAVALSRMPPQETLKPVEIAIAAPPVAITKQPRHIRRPLPTQPLRVKMLTSDPDVVIYWIVDKKEGIE